MLVSFSAFSKCCSIDKVYCFLCLCGCIPVFVLLWLSLWLLSLTFMNYWCSFLPNKVIPIILLELGIMFVFLKIILHSLVFSYEGWSPLSLSLFKISSFVAYLFCSTQLKQKVKIFCLKQTEMKNLLQFLTTQFHSLLVIVLLRIITRFVSFSQKPPCNIPQSFYLLLGCYFDFLLIVKGVNKKDTLLRRKEFYYDKL